jgi:hypothetical protein
VITVSLSGIEGSTEADLRQCALHCLKIIASIDNPNVERVSNVLIMVVLNCILNIDGWDGLEERDSIPPLINFEVLRALRELDEYDREHGGHA